jgi:GxxExxY protein
MNANGVVDMSLEKNLSEVAINCGFEVSNRLGTGFPESVYENALCVELEKKELLFISKNSLKLFINLRLWVTL